MIAQWAGNVSPSFGDMTKTGEEDLDKEMLDHWLRRFWQQHSGICTHCKSLLTAVASVLWNLLGSRDYIHSYQQNPNQSPQYVIHGLWSTVNSSMASLNTASDRKCSTLVLPQVTLRDTTVYYCNLREAHWDRRGCTCAVFLWWEEGGTQRGSSHESKSRVIWKESQRAVRDEENEGKEKGKRCIKKR